jgi:hypothetical protein
MTRSALIERLNQREEAQSRWIKDAKFGEIRIEVIESDL